MSERLSDLECPRDNERLIKALGNLLVCPNCDLIFIEPRHSNNWLGKSVHLLPEQTIMLLNEQPEA